LHKRYSIVAQGLVSYGHICLQFLA